MSRRQVEENLLAWWTFKYVYGLQQRVGGGEQKRQISLALSKFVTLFSLPFLYIGQSIFKNCFLLEANNSRCFKEFTEREKEREQLCHYLVYNSPIR